MVAKEYRNRGVVEFGWGLNIPPIPAFPLKGGRRSVAQATHLKKTRIPCYYVSGAFIGEPP